MGVEVDGTGGTGEAGESITETPLAGASRLCPIAESDHQSHLSRLDDEMTPPVLLITGFGAFFAKRALFAVRHNHEAVTPDPKLR